MKDYFDKWLEDIICLGKDEQAVTEIKELVIHALMMGTHICAQRINNLEEALCMAKSAVDLAPNNPKLNTTLALIYFKLDNLDLALDYSSKCIDSGLIECYVNHGLILEAKKDKTAREFFKKASTLSPNNRSLHEKLYEICYNEKLYEESLYEVQWVPSLANGKAFISRFHDMWNAKDSLKDKTVLLFNEHGFGDAIQNSRFIEYVHNAGGHTIFEVDKCQANIFENVAGIDEVIGRNDVLDSAPPPVDYDYAVSTACLPYYFGLSFKEIKTDPYLPVAYNKDNLGVKLVSKCDKMKVGIIWAGNIWHVADKYRSCPLKYFQPFSEADVQLFSLQKGDMKRSHAAVEGENLFDGGDVEVVDLLEGSENVKFIDLSQYLIDFKATAEILLALDLLITIDSSVGHLAGSMGVPTWILLSEFYDWRWDYKLYKNHVIFKQKKLDDWESLTMEVANKLKETI